jgi:DNA-binding NarL/FixJ family response regulator
MTAPTADTRRPLCVLLLDDDTFLLSLLEDMLGEIGEFTVLPESDARRALGTLAQAKPDLLVCDLSLPGMDGIEFLQAAARTGYQGQVLLLSGMDEGVRRAAERLARAHGLQVLGAYPKPISVDALHEALRLLAATDPQLAARMPAGVHAG